jgi:hypothetical protein
MRAEESDPVPPSPAQHAASATPPAPAAEREAGYREGWYESSWDLRAGLTVIEDSDVTVPGDLL